MGTYFSDEDLEENYRPTKEELEARQRILQTKLHVIPYQNYKNSSEYVIDQLLARDLSKEEKAKLRKELHRALDSEGKLVE